MVGKRRKLAVVDIFSTCIEFYHPNHSIFSVIISFVLRAKHTSTNVEVLHGSSQSIKDTLTYILFSLLSTFLAAMSRFLCAFTCLDEICENLAAICEKKNWKNVNIVC